jgi:hypothetical protein
MTRISLYSPTEKLCDKIERQLTRGRGYDKNSGIRKSTEQCADDHDIATENPFGRSPEQYILLKRHLAQKEQNPDPALKKGRVKKILSLIGLYSR